MAADDQLIGKKLGDYFIQGLLGRGGMSRVYRGYDENLQRYAAVKVISGDFATTTEEEYTRRFTSEARAIAHLRHPNIVGIYQFGRTEGIYYMAQVFLEGKDLRTLLKEYAEKNQRVPVDEILRITQDVTNALDYAHEQGVIHRDIKPSNIMLEKKTGRAILMDFGLALSIHEGTMGDTFGSAHYIAPEQAISSAKSVPQSDLYSWGIVLYEMLTGKVPFDDPSVMSVALKHLNEIPPPPRLYNPDLPLAVEAVIMRVLDKDPKRRYATGAELASDLEHAFWEAKPPVPAGVTTPPITDMMDSRPSSPSGAKDRSLPPVSPRLTPPPVAYTDADKSDSGLSALAGRFARRRQQKEDEAALESLSDEELEIDEDTLGSILDSYADPRDIGLVGPDAKGITLPERPADSRIRPPDEKPRRRVRLGLLLPLVLVIAILAGAVWIGTRGSGGDQESGGRVLSSTEQTQTATIQSGTRAALLAAGNQTATANARPTASPTPAKSATRPSTATSQASPPGPATGSSAGSGVTETIPATIPATAMAVPATGTPTASRTATVQPSETATEQPTETPLPPTASPTPAPSKTPTTIPATVTATIEGSEPTIHLIYDGEQFLLVNVSDHVLDVSQLIFEQNLSNGTTRSFRTTNWNRDDIGDPTDQLRSGGCYQLLTANATQMPPSVQVCPQFLGYFRSTVTRRYFWLSDEPGAVFTVRYTSSDTLLATCPIDAGECAFYLGPAAAPVATPAPTPTPASPSPAASETPVATTPGDLRMLYGTDSFLIVNMSNRVLDLSQLMFEQELPDSAMRRFDAQEWDRPGVLSPPSEMSAGGCYELVTGDGTQTTPSHDICTRFLGWFRTGVSGRYFWLSDQPGAVFTVRNAATDTVIGTCPIDTGTCVVSLPEP